MTMVNMTKVNMTKVNMTKVNMTKVNMTKVNMTKENMIKKKLEEKYRLEQQLPPPKEAGMEVAARPSGLSPTVTSATVTPPPSDGGVTVTSTKPTNPLVTSTNPSSDGRQVPETQQVPTDAGSSIVDPSNSGDSTSNAPDSTQQPETTVKGQLATLQAQVAELAEIIQTLRRAPSQEMQQPPHGCVTAVTCSGKGSCGGGDGGGGGGGGGGSGGSGGSSSGSSSGSRDESDKGGGGRDVVSQLRDDSSVSDTNINWKRKSICISIF
ncbi:uncharacterized protein DDB_G0284671-like [Procambarus clarkii]|uniref:uncharacterized protein DDB_G0284671-like n=1 Tax=Procambarus clarkii TaxID=6728 RepID=UPI0037447E66